MKTPAEIGLEEFAKLRKDLTDNRAARMKALEVAEQIMHAVAEHSTDKNNWEGEEGFYLSDQFFFKQLWATYPGISSYAAECVEKGFFRDYIAAGASECMIWRLAHTIQHAAAGDFDKNLAKHMH